MQKRVEERGALALQPFLQLPTLEEEGGYQSWVRGSAQGPAVKLMTISFMGGGRSMPDWAGGMAEV